MSAKMAQPCLLQCHEFVAFLARSFLLLSWNPNISRAGRSWSNLNILGFFFWFLGRFRHPYDGTEPCQPLVSGDAEDGRTIRNESWGARHFFRFFLTSALILKFLIFLSSVSLMHSCVCAQGQKKMVTFVFSYWEGREQRSPMILKPEVCSAILVLLPLLGIGQLIFSFLPGSAISTSEMESRSSAIQWQTAAKKRRGHGVIW